MPTRSRASHTGGNVRAPRASKTSWALIAAGGALIILAALMYAAVEAYRPAQAAPVGQFMFKLRVAEASAPQPAPAPVAQREVRYRMAFSSYCSKDRDKVARGLQGLKRGMKWAGIDYFMDMQDIESGEHWRQVIQKNLDESDLFILFWSSAAKSSEQVYKEIRYALARKGGSEENPPYFEPITIELPLPAPPPELSELHFNDELLYIITAEESLRKG